MSADIATSNSSSCLRLLFLHVYHSEIAICMILHHCLLVLHLIVHLHLYSSLYYYLAPIHPFVHPSRPPRPCPTIPSLASVLPCEAFTRWVTPALGLCLFVRPSVCLGTYCLLVCSIVLLLLFRWMFDVSFDVSYEDAQLMNLLLFAGILEFRNLCGRYV